MTTSSTSTKATRREWIGLAVLALPCILATMDLTVLNLAVPHLSAELKPSSSQLLWIMDIYGFMIAGSLITMGTLGDRIGRRKLLLMGAGAFGVASIMAAFSKSAETLIATRAVLGVAGATLAPSTLSLIRNMFHDADERTLAIGIWVTCFSVGATIGPVLGGVVLEHFHWSAVFLLNVPIMILLLILGPMLLPEFRDPNAGRLDLPSAFLSLISVLLVIFGVKKIAEYGGSAIPLGCMALGITIGMIFLRRQRQLPYPLIDLTLFRSPSFTASLLMNLLGCFVAFGAFFFTAQYLQLVLGLSPLKAGLWSTPSSVAFTVGSLVTPHLVKRFRDGLVIAVGLVIAAVGFGMLAFVPTEGGLFLLVLALTVYSIGIAPIFTLATDLIVSAAPPERAGAAASLSETNTEFGGALGMAILGTLGTAFYRHQVILLLPSDVPPETADMVRGTLGGALAAAAQFPDKVGSEIILAAREAFTRAMHLTGWIDAAIVLIMAVVAIKMIRQRR